MNKIKGISLSNKLTQFTLLFFVFLSVWWFSIFFRGLVEGPENDLFTVVYPWVSLWGGIAGLIIANKWGGIKSVLGRAFMAFSLGLLGQAFGQAAYTYYIYGLGIEVPYPSIGDIGFFSTGPLYGYGMIQLARAMGMRISLKSYTKKISTIIIPVLFAALSYVIFLRGYEYDWASPLTIILDLGSPLIDAAYLSLAIIAYFLSRKFLGGIMKTPVLILLVAIILEAVADFTFLYQESRDIWYVGGINDYMYLLAYTAMAVGLANLWSAFKHIRES